MVSFGRLLSLLAIWSALPYTVLAQVRTPKDQAVILWEPEAYQFNFHPPLSALGVLTGVDLVGYNNPPGLAYLSYLFRNTSSDIEDTTVTSVPKFAQQLNYGYGIWQIMAHGRVDPTSIIEIEQFTLDHLAERDARYYLLDSSWPGKIDYGTHNNASGEPEYYFIGIKPTFIAASYHNFNSLIHLTACRAGPAIRGGFVGSQVFLGYDSVVEDATAQLDAYTLYRSIAIGGLYRRSIGDGMLFLRDIRPNTTLVDYGSPGSMVLNPIVIGTQPGAGSLLGSGGQEVIVHFDSQMFDTPLSLVDWIEVGGPVSPGQTSASWVPNTNFTQLKVNFVVNGTGKVTLKVKGELARSWGGVPIDGNTASDITNEYLLPGYTPAMDDHEVTFCTVGTSGCDASIDAAVSSFGAVRDPGGMVKLSWYSTLERDISHYVLEKRLEPGSAFVHFRNVPVGVEGNYSVVDSVGAWAYRLRECTVNGDTLFHAEDEAIDGAGLPENVGVEYSPELIDSLATAQAGSFPPLSPSPTACEWVCFVPSAWANAAQPLANFWTAQGHPAEIVTLESIGGPGNIRNYIMLHSAIKYVLLMGDANDHVNWDRADLWYPVTPYRKPWNAASQPTRDIIPMSRYVVDASAYGEGVGGNVPYWSTDWDYGDRNGDGTPEISVGRAPVRSAAEVTSFVQKTLTAAQMTAVPLQNVGVWTYSRDNGSARGTSAHAIGAQLGALVPHDRVLKTLEDSDWAPMTATSRWAAARSALDVGRSLVVVSGTGANYWNWCGWLDHLQSGQAWSWSASIWRIPPFVLGTACGIGAVDMTEYPALPLVPDRRPLLELGVIDPFRGPWGGFAPSRGGKQHAHSAIGSAFLRELYGGQGGSAGDCARRAIVGLIAAQPLIRSTAESYVFIGDPLMPLRTSVEPPTVTIAGPTLLSHSQQGTWSATAGSGDGTYSYQWFYQNSPSQPWVPLGTGASQTRTMGGADFKLRCEVRSNGKMGSAEYCVAYSAAPSTVSAEIIGPTTVPCGASAIWTCVAAGGRTCSQYSYAWSLSVDGGNSWGPVVETGPSFSTTLYFGVSIRAVATAVYGAHSSATTVLQVYVDCSSPGCPTVDVKTHNGWITENTILSRDIDGAMGLDNYKLKAPVSNANGSIEVRIRESEQERTYLDEVRLVAVDHSASERAIAWGDRVVVGTVVPAVRVLSSRGDDLSSMFGNDALPFVGRLGDTLFVDMYDTHALRVAQPLNSSTHDGGGEVIDDGGGKGPQPNGFRGLSSFDFNGQDVDSLVLSTSGIAVDVPDGAGGWRYLRTHYPRERPDMATIDTIGFDRLRLRFIGQHAVRSIGRVVKSSEPLIAAKLPLLSASHSRLGDVSHALSSRGNVSCALDPGDTLHLRFGDLPLGGNLVREMFLLTNGVYGASLPSRAEHALVGMPARMWLHAPEPNPAGRSTNFRFELSRTELVRLDLYDVQGRRVHTVAAGRLPAGYHVREWNLSLGSGERARPGVYLCRFTAGSYRAHRKIVIIP